ncbi:FMN-dependent dehydrogenase-domain-containing protein [Pisolithus microcarpus]|nr:FMN-dependent dehydrogenase-domain-containing protein [Pisolithus microcarpus]
MSTFTLAQNHPGGPQVIMDYAGQDATAAFVPIHPSDTLDKYLPREKHLGALDEGSTRELRAASRNKGKSRDELRVEEAVKDKPPLGRMINVQDIEASFTSCPPVRNLNIISGDSEGKFFPTRQWLRSLPCYIYAYQHIPGYSENARAFSRFFFHPRVMKAVSGVDPSTTMLGYKTSIPIYISGSALARLGHPLGEANLTRGAYKSGILQMVSSNSSLSYTQVAGARGSSEQPLFFQLYKHKNDDIAARCIREVEELGYKAIFLTVDALVPSNRELDTRAPHYLEEYENQGKIIHGKSTYKSGDVSILGTAGGLIVNNDLDMTWEKTIPWIRSVTKLPIVVKGIQCVADAVLAVEAGCEGIVFSLPPMEVLYKIRCERPDVLEKTEVYIDGGVHRGTDVLKALCLGARMVGLGRAFLYAQSAYGEAGVVHLVRILEREIKFAMASLGVRTVDQLAPELVERVDWQPLSPKL